jgi:hypothetical protein
MERQKRVNRFQFSPETASIHLVAVLQIDLMDSLCRSHLKPSFKLGEGGTINEGEVAQKAKFLEHELYLILPIASTQMVVSRCRCLLAAHGIEQWNLEAWLRCSGERSVRRFQCLAASLKAQNAGDIQWR